MLQTGFPPGDRLATNELSSRWHLRSTTVAGTSSNTSTTQGDGGGQPPAAGPNPARSPLSFFDANGRPVTLIEFFAGDMASRGGHMSVSSKDGVSTDRVTIALASEISSAFVQGGAGFGTEALVATALEGLDWNDFRRLTQSGRS